MGLENDRKAEIAASVQAALDTAKEELEREIILVTRFCRSIILPY